MKLNIIDPEDSEDESLDDLTLETVAYGQPPVVPFVMEDDVPFVMEDDIAESEERERNRENQ